MGRTIKVYVMLLLSGSLAFFIFISIFFMNTSLRQHSLESLDHYLKLSISYATPDETAPELLIEDLAKNFSNDVRITLLDSNGVVLGDSMHDYETMENHSHREEIKSAITNGYGETIRYSETLGVYMLYVARSFDDYILRFSMPLTEVKVFSNRIIPVFFLILFLTFFIISFITNKLNQRIAASFDHLLAYMKGTIVDKQYVSNYGVEFDELKPIAGYFYDLTEEIAFLISRLDSKNNEILNIISSMEEGLVMLDPDLNVLMINEKAKLFLQVNNEVLNQNITFYYRDIRFVDTLKKTKQTGSGTSIDLSEGETVMRLFINPVADKGYVVLMNDISEIVRLEKIRSDFVANVSHELKTPLTSISGFSELITNGLVTEPDKIVSYNEKILKESKRLISLVNDLLKLSYIENKKDDFSQTEPENVDMNHIFAYIFETLAFQLIEKNITYKLEGQLQITAAEDMMYELAFNLVENAVKYNKKNGQINVTLFADESTCGFKIQDTGIGIHEKELDRIFERFYRVDKGRSRSTGGTGLGLSIVKHIVSLHNGEIGVTSTAKGTTFAIIFKIDQKKSLISP